MLEVLKAIGFTVLFLRFIYWIEFSLHIQEKKWKRVLVAQTVEGCILFFFFAQFFGNKDPFPINTIWVQYVGFLVTIFGVILTFLARLQLGSAWVYASAYRIVKNQPLITTGVYQFIRHPLYTGTVVSYAGAELLAGSWLWIAMLCFSISFVMQARKEEKILLNHFGEKYKEYQLRTKMLIPFVL